MKVVKFFLGLIITVSLQATWAKNIVILDAGSSGTRLHLYNVQGDPKLKLPKVQEVSLQHNTITPGINTFATHLADLDEYLEHLFQSLKRAINLKKIDGLYFYATAGMRTVALQDRRKIYRKISEYLTKLGVKKFEVRTLSGREESLFDWLSVNYANNAFASEEQPFAVTLDLGGGSMQVAYLAPDDAEHYDFKVSWANKHYKVIAHSVLGVGMDSMLDSLAAQNKNINKCFVKGLQFNAQIKGDFGLEECVALIDKYIANDAKSEQLMQMLRDAFKDNDYIVGFAGLYYVYAFFHAEDLESLYKNMQQECSLPYRSFSQQHAAVKPRYLNRQCFYGAYVYNLMMHSRLDTHEKINFVHKNFTWAQGAALYLS